MLLEMGTLYAKVFVLAFEHRSQYCIYILVCMVSCQSVQKNLKLFAKSYLGCAACPVSTMCLHVISFQLKIWTDITCAAILTEDVDSKQINNHLSSCAPRMIWSTEA